jgi:hypothetical protein
VRPLSFPDPDHRAALLFKDDSTAFPIQIGSVTLSEEPMAQVNILSLPIETVQGIVNVRVTRGQVLSDQFSSLLLSIAAATGAAGPKDASTGLFTVRPCL